MVKRWQPKALLATQSRPWLLDQVKEVLRLIWTSVFEARKLDQVPLLL
jgi:hypothetical protein